MLKNGIFRLLIIVCLGVTLSCASTQTSEESQSQSVGAKSGADEFSEFDSAGSATSPEAGVEAELAGSKSATQKKNVQPNAAADEFAEFDKPTEPAPSETVQAEPEAITEPQIVTKEEPTPEPPAPQVEMPLVAEPPVAEAPAPMIEPQPEVSLKNQDGSIANITALEYRSSDNGGTVVIEADAALEFSQRLNPATNQFVIEIPNAKLPRKLRRTLNTRDIEGSIGSIDAYQSKNGTTAKIVVQLRAGAHEPVVQAEGKHLFVLAQPSGNTNSAENEGLAEEQSQPLPSKLLSSDNIEDFLASNQSFYGKRISVETDDADLRDVFRFISDESNVNLIISDEVKGKVSLKLKGVPWDQALVMIMKAKKLGYTRAGNVLRIAPLADIKSEEEDAQKYIASKKANATFKVKTLQVNYAKVEELEKQVKPLLSAKGSVVADTRTSGLIISDVDENILRAEKLVRALDIPPQQVIIEGKVVEASEEFERGIGVNWNATGRRTSGSSRAGVNALDIGAARLTNRTFGINFSLGTMDILGNLSASLALFERQGLVKVISSPRVMALHNEAAEITQMEELPIITSTPNPGGNPTPSVSYKQVRLKLQVTPQITNDGVVILGVDVMREIPGADSDPTTKARGISSRSAKTKVMVRNSQTAVIGGIYQNDSSDSNTSVPGLGSIPILGWLFKSNTTNKKRTELMIFITPRIMGQLENSAAPNLSNQGGIE